MYLRSITMMSSSKWRFLMQVKAFLWFSYVDTFGMMSSNFLDRRDRNIAWLVQLVDRTCIHPYSWDLKIKANCT